MVLIGGTTGVFRPWFLGQNQDIIPINLQVLKFQIGD